MRMTTGFLIIFVFLFGFFFTLVQVTAEMEKVQTIPEILNSHIQVEEIVLSQNSYILDRHQQVVSEIYRDYNRIYLHFEEIPPTVVTAFLATEDRRFFQHKGFDSTGILRALLVNVQHDDIQQGASTITQQLVRNYYLGHEQTYNRKLSELLYAYQLEQRFSKEEILELYINTIYFQNGVYGIEAASRYYFNRPTSELSLAQIAFLTAVPNNPSYYNPLTNSDRTLLRQKWILEKMLEVKAIDQSEFHAAIEEEIELQLAKKIDRHPDYVTYIHEELKDLVSAQDGYDKRLATARDENERNEIEEELTKRVESLLYGGITIYTALDPKMQIKAAQAVNQSLANVDIQGATAVIDNEGNELIAITGGKDYQKFKFHRGFQAFRQPGSSIKPLLVYAPHLQETGASLQARVNANHYCHDQYCPKNFSGREYGNVTIETAFKYSYNTPAVRLLEGLGIQHAFRYLEPFAFEKLHADDYGLPAAIGGFTHGMSVLELTNAYTTFAQDGLYQRPYAIREVTDRNGNVIYKWDEQPVRVWDSETNEKMRKLLTKVVTEGTARNANFRSKYIGGKTGTTNRTVDLWFIGLTENYTTGVWVGRDTQQTIESIATRNPQLQIWKRIME